MPSRFVLAFVTFVLAGLMVACPTPAPKPDPPPAPVPTSFVCSGPESVPDFDAVANALVLAAQEHDDTAAFSAVDRVAAARGGAAVVDCVIDEILLDLRGAPITGVHLEAWEAQHQVRPAAGLDGGAQ